MNTTGENNTTSRMLFHDVDISRTAAFFIVALLWTRLAAEGGEDASVIRNSRRMQRKSTGLSTSASLFTHFLLRTERERRGLRCARFTFKFKSCCIMSFRCGKGRAGIKDVIPYR